jgi:hypothetical protein
MKRRRSLTVLALLLTVTFVAAWTLRPLEKAGKFDYPEPRFPSYLKPPKSVEDLMPQARAYALSKEGTQGQGMGKFNHGDTLLLVPDVTAEPLPLEAVRRALIERGINVVIKTEAEMVGLTDSDGETYRKATVIPSAQKGYLEARNYWISDYPRVFAHPEIAKKWLKDRRPDLYDALYPKDQELSPELKDKMSMRNIGAAIRDYLDKHPEVSGVYWGKEGGGFYFRYLAPQQAKHKGFTIFTNQWALGSQLATFPSDVFHLIEKKTVDLMTLDIDKVRVTDPEGTDISWDVSPEMANRWINSIYAPNHLLMYPDTATGKNGFRFDKYPTPNKEWTPREPIAMANGVIAGTNGSGGFWPRMEITYKNGYMTEVKGGGLYGDVIRQFLEYPHINDTTYPYYDHPGFWHLWELALGTNPKYFRNPSDFYGGGHTGIYCLTFERYRTGVFHWGFGNEIANEPGSFGLPAKWLKFGEEHDLPTGHDFHIHNYFATYKVHRASSDKWVTVVDRGHLVALDDPEVRALASRYGDPDKILNEDWIPEIPGINAPGSYEEYSKDPWNFADAQMKKIMDGSYGHYYPQTASQH